MVLILFSRSPLHSSALTFFYRSTPRTAAAAAALPLPRLRTPSWCRAASCSSAWPRVSEEGGARARELGGRQARARGYSVVSCPSAWRRVSEGRMGGEGGSGEPGEKEARTELRMLPCDRSQYSTPFKALCAAVSSLEQLSRCVSAVCRFSTCRSALPSYAICIPLPYPFTQMASQSHALCECCSPIPGLRD